MCWPLSFTGFKSGNEIWNFSWRGVSQNAKLLSGEKFLGFFVCLFFFFFFCCCCCLMILSILELKSWGVCRILVFGLLDPGRERICPFPLTLPPTNYLWRGISCVLLMSIAGGCSGSSLNTETCEPPHSGIRQPVSLFIRVLVFSLQGIQTN